MSTNVVYTYYNQEETHTTAKLSTKNLAKVFSQEQICLKIDASSISWDHHGERFVMYYRCLFFNPESAIEENNKRLFKLITGKISNYKIDRDCDVEYLNLTKNQDGTYTAEPAPVPFFIRMNTSVKIGSLECFLLEDSDCYIGCCNHAEPDCFVKNTCCDKVACLECYDRIKNKASCSHCRARLY